MNTKLIAKNPTAYHNYNIKETIEDSVYNMILKYFIN